MEGSYSERENKTKQNSVKYSYSHSGKHPGNSTFEG